MGKVHGNGILISAQKRDIIISILSQRILEILDLWL
jgi:hypothetical protein